METRKIIHWGIAGLLAVCLLGAKCQEESRSSSDPLMEKAEERYAEGRRLFLTCDPNNYKKAIQSYEDALARHDDYPKALAAWAEAVSMWYGFQIPEMLFQDAYMRAQRSIRLDPDLDIGYRAMADLFRHHKNPDTGQYDHEYALKVIERAIVINPNSAENLYVKGSIYLSKDPEQALQILSHAQALNPNLGKIYFNMANAHQLIADAMMFKNQDDPKNLSVNNKELIANHYQQADKIFNTYLKLVPEDLSGYCSLGILRMRQNKIPEAKGMFQKTVSLNPKPDPSQERWRIMAYLHLAQIAEYEKDLEGARTHLERVLDLAPQNHDALSQIIKLSRALKDEESAKLYEEKLRAAIESIKPKVEDGSTVEEKTGDTSGEEAGGTTDK